MVAKKEVRNCELCETSDLIGANKSDDLASVFFYAAIDLTLSPWQLSELMPRIYPCDLFRFMLCASIKT